jgi:hypothetical protein
MGCFGVTFLLLFFRSTDDKSKDRVKEKAKSDVNVSEFIIVSFYSLLSFPLSSLSFSPGRNIHVVKLIFILVHKLVPQKDLQER